MSRILASIILLILLIALVHEPTPSKIYDTNYLCKAAISLEFSVPVTRINTREIGNEVIYLSYRRLDDSSFWSYHCRLDGSTIIWSTPNGRWRNDYSVDSQLTYKVKESDKTLTVTARYPDGSKTSKRYSYQELTGKEFISDDISEAELIKKLRLSFLSGRIEPLTALDLSANNSSVFFSPKDLTVIQNEKRFSLFRPSRLNEKFKNEFLSKVSGNLEMSVSEFNTSIDVLLLYFSLKYFKDMNKPVFMKVLNEDSSLGVLAIEASFAADSEWHSIVLETDLASSKMFRSANFDEVYKEALEFLRIIRAS